MTIKEIETKLKELAETEKSIKAEIDNLQVALVEATNKEKVKLQIPDDVRDIPTEFSTKRFMENKSTVLGFIVGQDGIVQEIKMNSVSEKAFEGDFLKGLKIHRRLFPTRESAESFQSKTQFLADCQYFKDLYDCDYNPDWSDYNWKYYVVYDPVSSRYGWEVESYVDCGTTYFSTEEIADKCAEWLNYIYKKGTYAE